MINLTKTCFLIFGFLVASNSLQAAEITDMEFNSIGTLWITYYSGKNNRIDCTVFNEKGTPIGGGFGYASGGVARVMVQVTKKYQFTKVTAECKSE